MAGEGGTAATVRLVKVIDPADGADQFQVPTAGTRFVAVELDVTDTAKAALSDDADVDTSVVGSNDQSYTAAIASLAGCTNFTDGTFTLAPGESSTGCVPFEIPKGVTVAKVHFGLEMGVEGTVGEWSVGRP